MSTSYSDSTCIFWLNPCESQTDADEETGFRLVPNYKCKTLVSLLLSFPPHYPCGILSLSGKVCSPWSKQIYESGPGEGRGYSYFWFPISSTCASSFLLESFSLLPPTSMAVLICILNIGFVWPVPFRSWWNSLLPTWYCPLTSGYWCWPLPSV